LSAAQPKSIKIEVIDTETNISTSYNAIKAAARALGIDKRYIEHSLYLNQNKPVLGKYIFNIINTETEDLNLNELDSDVVKVQKTSKKVEVLDINTKEVTIYPSIGAAARALGYRQPSISLYLKENRTNAFKGRYFFKFI
jgi:hypothetical protein